MLVYQHTFFLFWLEPSQVGWYLSEPKTPLVWKLESTATAQLQSGEESDLITVPVQDPAMTASQIGLFYTNIALFYTNTGLFFTDVHPRTCSKQGGHMQWTEDASNTQPISESNGV